MVVKSDGLKTKDLYKTIHKASKLKAQKYNNLKKSINKLRRK